MIDNHFQNIFNKAKQVKLLIAEKDNMRASLELFAEKYPVRNTDFVRPILEEKSKSNISSLLEILTLKSLINKIQPMAIALIIALIIGGGTSFAAENALPGDILYPVKIKVNEEVRSFVAFSDLAQAKWDAQRAERRLQEGEKLATEGRLDTKTRAQLESRFENHAEMFKESAEETETKQNTKDSFEINSNFEASLKAHEQILTKIAREKASVREEVETLLLEVRTRLNATAKARGNAEAKVSAETDNKFKTAAEGKLEAAENKIGEVRGFMAKVKSSMNGETYAQAEVRLGVAVEAVARGKTEMDALLYGKAFASFQEAIRIAQETKLLVKIENRIDLGIKAPGLDLRLDLRLENDDETKDEGHMKKEEKIETKTGQDSSLGVSLEASSKTRIESKESPNEFEESEKLKIDLGL